MSRQWLSQMRKGLIEYCILEVLQKQGESYGYAILKSLEAAPSLRFNESAVYLALGRMLKAGSVSCRQGVAETGRKRRYFKLTPQGYEILQDMRHEWRELSQAIAELQRGDL